MDQGNQLVLNDKFEYDTENLKLKKSSMSNHLSESFQLTKKENSKLSEMSVQLMDDNLKLEEKTTRRSKI